MTLHLHHTYTFHSLMDVHASYSNVFLPTNKINTLGNNKNRNSEVGKA